MERKISTLFKDLCCSVCKSDFGEESVSIIRQEKSEDENILVIKLVCQNCGKSFGLTFLGISDIDLKEIDDKDLQLKIKGDAPPITSDDVLDAHKFIKNLDKDWGKYIPKKE